MCSPLYALHDSDPNLKKKGVFKLKDASQAKELNKAGYGIFHCPNEFKGSRRIENLVRIKSLYLDIDNGTKEDQMKIIQRHLEPTVIIETKRGYQVYYYVDDFPLSSKEFSNFLKKRMVPVFDSDPHAVDVTRLLRVPGYLHQKDPKDPFEIKVIFSGINIYSKTTLENFFKIASAYNEDFQKKTIRSFSSINEFKGDIFQRINSMDQEDCLRKLSGSVYVNGEFYDFKYVANQTKCIVVNNIPSSCWIDRNGKIGSTSGGGPTIIQWLMWFGHSKAKAIAIIKKEFNL